MNSDTKDMATVRHELLNILFNMFPLAQTKPSLLSDLRPVFKERDKVWLTDAIADQLVILSHAGLIRPSGGGYTLTERGRKDREAARKLFHQHTKEKA